MLNVCMHVTCVCASVMVSGAARPTALQRAICDRRPPPHLSAAVLEREWGGCCRGDESGFKFLSERSTCYEAPVHMFRANYRGRAADVSHRLKLPGSGGTISRTLPRFLSVAPQWSCDKGQLGLPSSIHPRAPRGPLSSLLRLRSAGS